MDGGGCMGREVGGCMMCGWHFRYSKRKGIGNAIETFFAILVIVT